MPPVAYFVGKAGLVLVSTVLQLALLIILANLVFDVPYPVDAAHWWTFAWVGLLGSVAMRRPPMTAGTSRSCAATA